MVLGERNTVNIEPRLTILKYRVSNPINCANIGCLVIISKIAVEVIIVDARACAEFNWEIRLVTPPIMFINLIGADDDPFWSFNKELALAACCLAWVENFNWSCKDLKYAYPDNSE